MFTSVRGRTSLLSVSGNSRLSYLAFKPRSIKTCRLAGTNSFIVIFPGYTCRYFFGHIKSDDFNRKADVRFITLKEKTVYDKVFSRCPRMKPSIRDGRVRMEARSPVSQILRISVWVFREREAANLHRDENGPVELEVKYGKQDIDEVCSC